jgi:hypothetical protein
MSSLKVNVILKVYKIKPILYCTFCALMMFGVFYGFADIFVFPCFSKSCSMIQKIYIQSLWTIFLLYRWYNKY